MKLNNKKFIGVIVGAVLVLGIPVALLLVDAFPMPYKCYSTSSDTRKCDPIIFMDFWLENHPKSRYEIKYIMDL